MNDPNVRLTGVELYFHDLEAAKHFYLETLGLRVGLRRELVGSHPWAAVRDPEGHTVVLRQSTHTRGGLRP